MTDSRPTASATSVPIRVMIVDDHPIVRDGLKSMLLAFDDLKLVGEVGDSRAVLAASQEYQPDVILMDIHMPGIDGIAATHLVLAQYPQSRYAPEIHLRLGEYAFDEHEFRRAEESYRKVGETAPPEIRWTVTPRPRVMKPTICSPGNG